jgi:hypothetical protein
MSASIFVLASISPFVLRLFAKPSSELSELESDRMIPSDTHSEKRDNRPDGNSASLQPTA